MESKTNGVNQRDHSGIMVKYGSKKSGDYSHIKGWGADLDHKNRPAYPKERTPPRLEGLHWHDIEDQPINTKVYHSIERSGVTPVFGTSVPPTGVSGKIRGAAYRLSENDVRHWLLLQLADRINVVEGLGEDLLRGHVPNIFAEMGWKAEWKHNPVGLVTKVTFASAILVASYLFLTRRKNH